MSIRVAGSKINLCAREICDIIPGIDVFTDESANDRDHPTIFLGISGDIFQSKTRTLGKAEKVNIFLKQFLSD